MVLQGSDLFSIFHPQGLTGGFSKCWLGALMTNILTHMVEGKFLPTVSVHFFYGFVYLLIWSRFRVGFFCPGSMDQMSFQLYHSFTSIT